jgi:alkylation response protein AidB-like acyl-CoA dehydrogenase
MTVRFEPTELTADELDLQGQVRAFLAAELPRGSYTPGLGMSAPKDPAFSRKLAERGWLGMALPRRYGGHDRSAVDRFVVVEELLRWGAPVGHHWVADRQTGSVIARFGTEAQKQRFLPAICRGELSFSIGMSEPDAGSDLAAVQTRATPVEGGWVLNGTKVWTSGAHENDWFVVLCRTTPLEEAGDKRRGLSQMLVDLRSPGLEVSPIPFLDGSLHFNEVVLRDVFVPDDLVLGEVGMGWAQNTSELAYERGGPDRWLSTYLVVEEWLRHQADRQSLGQRELDVLGGVLARWWAIRNLSLTVARMIDRGEAPSVESALVKELGTRFEQDVLAAVSDLVAVEPTVEDGDLFVRVLVAATLTAPSFTVRGGTIEILRSVAAKGLR